MAAATPPSAITVCALPRSDLQTSAVRRPRSWASTAARSPAPPAPITITSYWWDSYSAICSPVPLVLASSSPRPRRLAARPTAPVWGLEVEARVVEGPAGHQPDVQVGE